MPAWTWLVPAAAIALLGAAVAVGAGDAPRDRVRGRR